MLKKISSSLTITLALVILFSVSYIYFTKYSPKVLTKINEVKGLSNISTDDFPYPSDAVKIGTNRTPASSQTTFRTSKPKSEISEFYKNIYISQRWKNMGESVVEGTNVLNFKNDTETINIVITEEGNIGYTIVSIEKTTIK